jgi:hypothetical protein
MSKKDLHVSYRISTEMLKFYEAFMETIYGKVGAKVPQSQIMRAVMAVIKDDRKIYDTMVDRISSYVGKDINRW